MIYAMIDRISLAVLLGLLSLTYALHCPKQKTSPGREVVCYTSASKVEQLTEAVCKCTTLIQQGYDVRNLSTSAFKDFQKSLKDINGALQFAISVNDPAKTLRTSGIVRQEITARLIGVLKEVDGIELNMTAGSKERLVHFIKGLKDELIRKSYDKRIFLVLPTKSEDLGKQFDLKELSKYVDLFTIPTHYLIEDDEAYRTFHPARLMGLFDMYNADSLIDFVSGLGAPKRKILISLPANAYRFTLTDQSDNAPRAPTVDNQPSIIDQKELCDLMNNGEWTVERDEDLTAPYAFKNSTWIAFEDKISATIKGKYALVRDLPGLGIYGIENDFKTDCAVPLTHEIHHSFSDFKRKSRGAVLNALEDDLHQMQLEYSTKVKSSDYRVTRVIDSEGHIRAVRESTQTEFTCNRQGYFVHPKSCNRFYRCVKFNQEVEDYSVFEFDCPAGLSFDERTEVCVWPGSMPEGSPCPGSSEIAPVARVRFECPAKPGYYADPQNPRWFFACIDLGGPEMMAYEFRCPYGLIFDEQKLICEWPWLVQGYSGTAYTRPEYEASYGATGSTQGTGGYYTGGLPDGYTGTTAGIYSGSSGGQGYSGAAGVGYTGQGTIGSGYSGSVAGGSGHGISYTGSTGAGGHPQSEIVSPGHSYTRPTGFFGSSTPGYAGPGGSGDRGHGISYGDQTSTSYGGSSGSGGNTGYSGTTGGGYSGAGRDNQGGSVHGYTETGAGSYNGKAGTSESGYTGSSHFGSAGSGVYTGTTGAGKASIGTSYTGAGTIGGGYSGAGSYNGKAGTSESGYTGSSHFGSAGSGVYTGATGAGKTSIGTSYTGAGTTGGGYSGAGSYNGQAGTSESGYTGSSHFGSTGSGVYTGATGTGKASIGTSYTGVDTTGSGYPGAGKDNQGGSIHGYTGTDTGTYNGKAGTSESGYTGSSHFGSTGSGVYTGATGTGKASIGTSYTGAGTIGGGYSGVGRDNQGGSLHGYTDTDAGTYNVKTGTSGVTYTGSGKFGSTGSGTIVTSQPGTGGVYGGSTGNQHVDGSQTSAGYDYSQQGGIGPVYTGSAGYPTSGSNQQGPTGISDTGSTGGSAGVKGKYPRPSYGPTTPGSTGFGYSGTSSRIPYLGSQTGPSGSGQNVPFGTRPTQTPIYATAGVTGTTDVYQQKPGPIFVDKPGPPNCITSCSGANVPSSGQTYATNGYVSTQGVTSGTNVYQGINSYTGGLNGTFPGSHVPSSISTTYHGISPSGGILTGSTVQGSIITGDSTPGTLISYGDTSGTVIQGSSDEGNIVTGGSYPGYTKSGPGVPGYVVTDGVKTVYPGSGSPGTVFYGTTSPGVVTTGISSPGTVLKGQSSPGIILTGQTAPGVSIGGSVSQGTIVGSTERNLFSGSDSQTQSGGVSSGSPYGTKIGTATSTFGKTTGYRTNEYHDNGGRGTIRFNNGDVTTKYTENDIPDYRPAGGTIPPDTLISGNKVVPGGPGGTGSTGSSDGKYIVSTGSGRTTSKSDNIGAKAFEGNVVGYTKTSTEPSTGPGTSRISLSKNTGYSYPTPSIPFETGVSKNSPISATENSNFGLTTTTPFLNVEIYNTENTGEEPNVPGRFNTYQRPTSAPGQSATGSLDRHRTTAFQSAKVPYTVSTEEPVIDTGFKTVISSTPAPFSEAGYDGNVHTGSQFDFGTKTQQANVPSTIPSSVFGSSRTQINYGPTTTAPHPTFGSTSKNVFGQSVTQPGVPYQYSTDIPQVTSGYDGEYNTNSDGSPAKVEIPRVEVGKLITNYDRGTTKYIPSEYDAYKPGSTSSSAFGKGYSSGTAITSNGVQTVYPGDYSKQGGYTSVATYQTTGKSTAVGKGKVIVKWSDLHPLLLGKLGAECTCRGDPFANLRGPGSKLIDSSKGKVDLSNYDESEIYVDLENDGSYEDNDYVTNYESSSAAPTWNNQGRLLGSSSSQTTVKPSTAYLSGVSSSLKSNVQTGSSAFSSNVGFNAGFRSGKSLSNDGASANSVSRQNSFSDHFVADDVSEEILDGATNCARPGLFRHPNFCNKFYACHWDEWKKKFTLHVFKCPVHLTYDDGVAACNWPSMGPACQDNNLLV